MEQIVDEVKDQLAKVATYLELDGVKTKYLGKTGVLAGLMAQIGKMPSAERKDFGQKVNSIKQEVQSLLDVRRLEIEEAELNNKIQKQKCDLTLPGRQSQVGKIHPISKVISELVDIFAKLGFNLVQGTSIETEWYNFTALNIPANHPARDMHDTFYLPKGFLLRTHTSPMQIRFMEKNNPPFRFISFGRTYRSDSDATHTPMFHQIEAIAVDKKINMPNLIWTLDQVLRQFFDNQDIRIRMRPSFFPFTKLSAEVDIYLPSKGKWLEVLGSGLIHPKVLQNVSIDPKEYSGFAFGMGIERLAMLKYGINDLRQFFTGDLNWLKHFGFN